MHTNMAKLILLVIIGCCGCSKNDSASDYVRGQAMMFPMKSKGVLEDFGARYLEHCKSPDESVEKSCFERQKQRVGSCLTPQPPIYQTRSEWRAAAKTYATCVEPNEICQGVDIVREDQLSLCK